MTMANHTSDPLIKGTFPIKLVVFLARGGNRTGVTINDDSHQTHERTHKKA